MSILKNEAQEQAIETTEGPVILVSCPGSGKTTTLVRRIHKIIENGVNPKSILMVTFTKDAARGMCDKYISMFGENPGVVFSTIHSLCFQILKKEKGITASDVLQESDARSFIFERLVRKHLNQDAYEMAGQVLTEISVVKNNYMTAEAYQPESVSPQLFRSLYHAYEDWKNENGKLDFDDMLILCMEMFRTEPAVLSRYQTGFRYIQCDEYQDTNFIQRDILYALAGKHHNLCVVGDDDQSIYAFRGARPEIMLGFEKDFPEARKIMMGTNYRSAQMIVDSADRLIKHNHMRYAKDFVSQRGEDGADGMVYIRSFKARKDQFDYVLKQIRTYHEKGVPYSEMAVLLRTNVQAELPVTTLSEAKIPYYSTENVRSIYESFIFQDIRSYCRLSCGIGTKRDFFNVLNHPNRFFFEGDFRGCDYTEKDMLAHLPFYSREEAWKRQQAERSISTWMRTFGPGCLTPASSPVLAMQKMNGAKSINYDKYLKEYADYRNLEYGEIREQWDLIEDDAKKYKTLEEWFTHADESIKKLKDEMNNRDRSGVVVTTMHRAKGLEWKVVFILDASEGYNPYKKSLSSPEAMEEERRLFYVAMTRAKDELHILYSGTESRYISELKAPVSVSLNSSQKRVSAPKKRERVLLDPKDVKKYLPGKKVLHEKFGEGQVVKYTPKYIVCIFYRDDKERVLEFPGVFCNGIMQYL